MLEEDAIGESDVTPDTQASIATPKTHKRRRRGIDRATIGVLALIAISAGGLYYMYARTAAGIAVLGDADANTASLTTLLTGGKESLTALAGSIRTTRDVVDRISERDTAKLAAAKPLGHDPFEFASLEPAQGAPTAPVNDNVANREQAKAKALAAARQINLQSIMYGSTRRSCLIDGKLYFEGQPVGDFTVARIATDSVLLQSGEFKFELRLRK